MGKLTDKLFSLEQWRIGWARGDVLDFVEQPSRLRFEWITPSASAVFLADPFGDERDGKLRIFAERLKWGEAGTIVSIDPLERDEGSDVLSAGWHLSYPFLVEERGIRWMCPEQAESGRVALHRLDAQGRIEPQPSIEILQQDLRDATFIRHEGRWWMFGTLEPSAGEQTLVLFHAEQLAGPWQPHPMNPIATGFSNTRSAGRVIQRGKRLLRPAQDSSTTYGGALVINEIVTLTPEDYQERLVRRIVPAEVAGAGPDGLHHVDHTASYVLIDSKAFRWHPFAWWFKLRDKRRRAAVAAARSAGRMTAGRCAPPALNAASARTV